MYDLMAEIGGQPRYLNLWKEGKRLEIELVFGKNYFLIKTTKWGSDKQNNLVMGQER